MEDVEELLKLLGDSNARARQTGLANLGSHLSLELPETFDRIDQIVNAVEECVKDANFKVSLEALNALPALSDRLAESGRAYLMQLMPAVLKCLGDGKEPVRDASVHALVSFMKYLSASDSVDSFKSCLSHRNWHVREQILRLLVLAASTIGAEAIPFGPFMPQLAQLVGDPNEQVREMTFLTFETIYRYVGEALRDDLAARNLRPAVMASILGRFEGVEVEQDTVPLYPVDRRDQPPPARKASGPTTTTKKAPPSMRSAASRESGRTTPASDSSTQGLNDSLEPIPVYSEAELRKEFDALALVLRDSKTQEWTERVKAIRRLRALVRGGAGDFDNFPSVLASLQPCIEMQVKDLRSKVPREACALLRTLSEMLGNAFETFADYIIPVLFNNLPVSKQAISEPADECIRFMIAHTRINRALSVILGKCTGKQNVLKPFCIAYVKQVLETYPVEVLESRRHEIESALIACVADANGDARATARAAFRGLARLWPERTNTIVDSLEASVQALVIKELQRPPDSHDGPPPSALSRPPSVASTTSSQGLAGSMRGAPTPGRGLRPGRKSLGGTVPAAARTNGPPARGAGDTAATAPPPSMRESLGPAGRVPSGAQASSAAASSRADPPSRPAARSGFTDDGSDGDTALDDRGDESFPLPASSREGGSGLGRPQRVPAAPAAAPKRGRASLGGAGVGGLGPAGRAPVRIASEDDLAIAAEDDSLRRAPPAATTKARPAAASVAKRAPPSVGGTDAEDTERTRPKARRQTLGGAPTRETASSRGRSETNGGACTDPDDDDDDDFPSSRINPRRQSMMPGSTPSRDPLPRTETEIRDDLGAALAKAESQVWSDRVTCFQNVLNMIEAHGERIAPAALAFDRLVKVLVAHLRDQHYKVVVCVIRALVAVVERCSPQLLPALEEMLPEVFGKLTDPKAVVVKHAHALMDTMRRVYGADGLLPVLMRVLQRPSHKVKVATLERIVELVEDPEAAYFQSATHLRQFIERVLAHAEDKNLAVKRASRNALAALHALDPTAFFEQLMMLPMTVQLTAKRSLGQQIAGFADTLDELSRAARQGRPVAAPAAAPQQPARDEWDKRPPAQQPPPPQRPADRKTPGRPAARQPPGGSYAAKHSARTSAGVAVRDDGRGAWEDGEDEEEDVQEDAEEDDGAIDDHEDDLEPHSATNGWSAYPHVAPTRAAGGSGASAATQQQQQQPQPQPRRGGETRFDGGAPQRRDAWGDDEDRPSSAGQSRGQEPRGVPSMLSSRRPPSAGSVPAPAAPAPQSAWHARDEEEVEEEEYEDYRQLPAAVPARPPSAGPDGPSDSLRRAMNTVNGTTAAARPSSGGPGASSYPSAYPSSSAPYPTTSAYPSAGVPAAGYGASGAGSYVAYEERGAAAAGRRAEDYSAPPRGAYGAAPPPAPAYVPYGSSAAPSFSSAPSYDDRDTRSRPVPSVPATTTTTTIPERSNRADRVVPAPAPSSRVPSSEGPMASAYSARGRAEANGVSTEGPRVGSGGGAASGASAAVPAAINGTVRRDERRPADQGPAALGGRSWVEEVPALLNQVTNGEGVSAALHRIILLSRENNTALWSQYFGQVLLVVTEALKKDQAPSRELALIVIKGMLEHQAQHFVGFVNVVVQKLLEAYRDKVREVSTSAEDALVALVTHLPPPKCLAVIVPLVGSEDGPTLGVCIRLVSRLIAKMTPPHLMQHLRSVLPGLLEAFKNSNADVRKAVVFCLVEMYMVLGDELTPFLSELSTSQLKLVTIYINRRKEKPDAGS